MQPPLSFLLLPSHLSSTPERAGLGAVCLRVVVAVHLALSGRSVRNGPRKPASEAGRETESFQTTVLSLSLFRRTVVSASRCPTGLSYPIPFPSNIFFFRENLHCVLYPRLEPPSCQSLNEASPGDNTCSGTKYNRKLKIMSRKSRSASCWRRVLYAEEVRKIGSTRVRR